MSEYEELKKQTELLRKIFAALNENKQKENESSVKTISLVKHEISSSALTIEEFKAKAIAGEIQVNDQIVLEFDGNPTLHDVIGINVDKPIVENQDAYISITIQMHDLIEERPFDTKGDYGSNVWETSEIRTYLNSDDFRRRYTNLPECLAKVRKENSSGTDTEDAFFLLSKDEFDGKMTPYPFYKNRRNKIKFNANDNVDWHWTRSAGRGSANSTWYVTSTGTVSSTASGAYRFAPACVLIFQIP